MANRYWVGGSGTWDNVSILNWSATSGGAPLASVPTSADNVVFDSASGTGTCTTASGSTCATATLNSSTLGLTLGNNHTMSGAFTLSAGVLNLQTFTLACSSFFSNNSTARTIAFGTGNISINGNAGSIINITTSTNLTVTGNPVINATYSGTVGTRTLSMGASGTGGTEANSVSLNIISGSDIVTIGGGMRDLNFTGFSGTLSANSFSRTIYGNLTLSSTMTLSTDSGATTFAATSGIKTITFNTKTIDAPIVFNGVGGTFQLQDNFTTTATQAVTLTNGTLDINGKTLSCGFFSSGNSNVRTIAFGSGNIIVTGSGFSWATPTTTNLTITGVPVVNISNNSSVATTVQSGTLPETSSISFNFTTGTYPLTFLGSAGYTAKNINFTGFAGTWNATAVAVIYGDLTLSTGMALTASANTMTFGGTSGTQTLTTNSKTVDFPLTFNGVGGTFSFADALTLGSTRAFTITNGTVKLKNGTTNTVGSFTTGAGTTQRFLQSTVAGTQATITDPSGVNAATYLTVQDIAATGGATWNAFSANNNVDAGNNTGWDFGISPSYTYEFPMKLRSFTERNRF